MSKTRVALCMRGAISKLFGPFVKKDAIYQQCDYVNYRACFESIRRHIIEPNKEKYDFDIFLHCWNPDLESDIVQLYKPKSYKFELNTDYNDEISKKCRVTEEFAGISQALTLKRVIEIKEEYEKENGFEYDKIILYRYDMLLWKDILLENYVNQESIYVNLYSECDDGCHGDFHFIMSNKNAKRFKYLYDSVEFGNHFEMHRWIKRYMKEYMRVKVEMDEIEAGRHQEVLRKIRIFSIWPGHLPLDLLYTYGISWDELQRYAS